MDASAKGQASLDAPIVTLNLPLIGIVERVHGMMGPSGGASAALEVLMAFLEKQYVMCPGAGYGIDKRAGHASLSLPPNSGWPSLRSCAAFKDHKGHRKELLWEDRHHIDGIFVKRSAAELLYGYQISAAARPSCNRLRAPDNILRHDWNVQQFEKGFNMFKALNCTSRHLGLAASTALPRDKSIRQNAPSC
eukprot:1139766-Pelagomonas_calceolata.AAC.2